MWYELNQQCDVKMICLLKPWKINWDHASLLYLIPLFNASHSLVHPVHSSSSIWCWDQYIVWPLSPPTNYVILWIIKLFIYSLIILPHAYYTLFLSNIFTYMLSLFSFTLYDSIQLENAVHFSYHYCLRMESPHFYCKELKFPSTQFCSKFSIGQLCVCE